MLRCQRGEKGLISFYREENKPGLGLLTALNPYSHSQTRWTTDSPTINYSQLDEPNLAFPSTCLKLHKVITHGILLTRSISCNWKCLTVWIMKRNPQLPHWGWIVTTGILQLSTTAPNHFPWPLKRRIRKPGFALSSQEEGIKVKYQWPGIEKGLVGSFIVTFFRG